jgi:hypothetical protein
MREGFLEALLHDIFGVFSPAGNAPRNEENPLLVTLDQDLEGSSISVLRRGDEGHVSFSGNTVDKSDRWFLSLDVVYKFGWHIRLLDSFNFRTSVEARA